MSVTAPLSAPSAVSPACPSKWRVSTRCTTCSTSVGNDRTHWRTGTWVITWSTRCADVSDFEADEIASA